MRILLPLAGPMNPPVREFFSQLTMAKQPTVAVWHVLQPSDGNAHESKLAAQDFLNDAIRDIGFLGSAAPLYLREGYAAREIVALARELDVDLIVMYGRTAGRHTQHNRSVMETVLANADRPAIAINDSRSAGSRALFRRVSFAAAPADVAQRRRRAGVGTASSPARSNAT